MVVWAGMVISHGGQESNTGGRYDPATDAWTPTSTLGAPSPRSYHSAVWTGSQMIVWGGDTSTEYLDTGGRYDSTTDAWSPVSNVDAPLARTGHTAVWTGSLMVIWGGQVSTSLGSGGRYAFGHASDNDGDGFSECEGDCNDDLASIFPGAPELCDGLDNDCSSVPDDLDADGDGYSGCSSDCDDSDPGAHAIPGEVTGLRFVSNGTVIEWDSAIPAAGSATVHDALTGIIGELPVGSGPSETCLESGIAATSLPIQDVPPPSTAYWYLVRGRNGCGAGTYGAQSDGDPRTSLACP
jgi:hypothetical protein